MQQKDLPDFRIFDPGDLHTINLGPIHYLHRLPRCRVLIVVDALLLREAEEVGQLFVQRLQQLLPHFRQRLQQLFPHLTTDGMKKIGLKTQKCQK